MKHGLAVCALASSLFSSLASPVATTTDGCCDDETTDVIGRVVLAGVPVGGANVRIDLRRVHPGHPGDDDRRHVQVRRLSRGLGSVLRRGVLDRSDFAQRVLRASRRPSSRTRAAPRTSATSCSCRCSRRPPATSCSAYLDGDGLEDFVGTYPDALFVWLSDGASRSCSRRASLTEAPFGPIAISDLDGDGNKDLAVTRIGTTAKPEIVDLGRRRTVGFATESRIAQALRSR